MEQNGATYEPKEIHLPEKCFSVLPSSDELIIIERNKAGYTPAGAKAHGRTGREAADAANKAMGVTKRQEAAMVAGSMFGWNVPGANPMNYDKDGNPVKPKSKHKDHER